MFKCLIIVIVMLSFNLGYGKDCLLTVEISAFKNNQGAVAILLFPGPEGFPQKKDVAIFSGRYPISLPSTTITAILPGPGTYAATVYHDENADQSLTTNFFGIPREGVGMSNNPKVKFRAPSFEQASFLFKCSENESIIVALHYPS